MKNLILKLVFCAFLIPSICYAQWEHLNFVNGGYASAITRDSSGYIFISTEVSDQIYRSSDNGNTWQLFTNDFPVVHINCLISTANAVYAGTYLKGVYKTTNHGINWFPCNNGIQYNEFIQSLALKDELIFAGGDRYIYRSSNGGIHWDTTGTEITNLMSVESMVAKGSVLYAATSRGSTGYMYKTTNNGTNWVLINNGLPQFFIENLAKCGNKVYASSWTDGLFETTNEGLIWTEVSLPGQGYVSTISSKGDTLVASLEGPSKTFHVTTNGGINWQSKLSDLPEISLNNLLFSPQGSIGTTNYGGIYKSTNLGTNWTSSMSGYSDVEIISLIAKDNIIIARTLGYATYRSTNFGFSWNKIQQFNNGGIGRFILQGNLLYTSYGGYILRSTDFGLTFIQQGSQLSGGFNSYAILNNFILVSTGSYIYRSTNGGLNWAQSNNGLPLPIFSLGWLFCKDTICFVSIENLNLSRTLFRSTNFGISWDSIPNAIYVASSNSIVFNPTDNNFYAGNNYGVYISSNFGYNWQQSNNGLPSSKNVTSFFFNGDTIYASLKSGGIYRSSIQSPIWTAYNEGLTNLNVNFIYGSNNYLYAGITYGGFFRRHANISISIKNNSEVCKDYSLFQNYPNPFNPTTNIKYQITNTSNVKSEMSNVKLIVYDILGKEIITLVNDKQSAGIYEVTFDGSRLASGIYFYKLQSGDFTQTRKMVLLK